MSSRDARRELKRGRRQRERRFVKRGEKTETRLPEQQMQRDGGQRGGQAAGRQAVHTCDPFTLRTSHGSVSAQWATVAKQAKCRQTFGSAWVPHIRPTVGPANLSRVAGRGLARVGVRGWVGASFPF